jgi:hypothetical protein
MNPVSVSLIFLGLAVFLCGTAEATVSCYSCNYTMNNCNDPFVSANIQTISGCSGCSKEVLTISGFSGDAVVRGCESAGDTTGCQTTTILGVSGTYCVCTGSMCNSAWSVSKAAVATTTVAAIVAMIANYRRI